MNERNVPPGATPRNREERRHPELVDIDGAARHLECTPRLIRELWTRRVLPGVKVGRLVRFDLADLDAYVDAQRVPAVRGPLAGAK